MGDFNINVTIEEINFDKLDEFYDLFNLTNLITWPTCFTKIHKLTIDLILTNKETCFPITKVTESGLSNFHKLISTFLWSHFSQMNPKMIYYRNYKKINEQKFIEYLKNINFCFNQTIETTIMN